MRGFLRKVSIKYTLMGWFSLLLMVTTIVAAAVVYSQVRETLNVDIHTQMKVSADGIKSMVETAARVSVRNRLRAIAEKNIDILNSLMREVEAGHMTEKEAREEGARILLSQTIGKTGYIYCMSTKAFVVVHPAKGMIGRDMTHHWLGNTQVEQREGYLEYEWANPGETEPRPKAMYMAYFEPFDWIVSVSSYREEFDSLIDINDFRDTVSNYKIGDSGYAFIVSTDGQVVLHPWIVGDIGQTSDIKGRKIFQHMIEMGDGEFTYWWQDPDRLDPRQKIILFRSIPELQWVVASTGYLDEIYAPLQTLKRTLILTGVLTILFILPLGYYLGSSFAKPLSKLAASMGEARRGDLSVRADTTGQGEVSDLAWNFNQYMDQLEEFSDDLKGEIEERVKAEQQLKLFAMVFENALEGISITDNSGNIVAINPSFTTITGYGPEEVLGKNPRVLKSDRHGEEFYGQMWKSLSEHGSWHGEIWNRRKNGESYPEILSISSIKDEEGYICNYVAVFHDISDMKLKDEQIEHQAYHDALTGLPNRSLAQDRLSVAIAHAKRDGSRVCVFYLDLDNFKKINDSMGHAAGDMLIQRVGERLTHDFSDADTVSRLGGDEFLLLFSDVNDERELLRIADRLLHLFDAPFVVQNKELEVTPSIGVTLFPDDGEDSETLIKNADMAMYQSKAKGKNSYFLFTKEMNDRLSMRLKMENDMRQALKDNEFTVYFQPQVNQTTNKVVGVEALVRWHKPDGTVVSPADFIPLAEETGFIVPLGEYVLEASCRAMQVFEGLGFSDFSVSVNLSPIQFEQENLVDMIISNLQMNGLSPEKLELEITESTLMTNVTESVGKLNMLSDHGISVAIDDFGTGHSSLYYLKNFPIDVLKVDRSFIRDITTDASDAQIVETIILMARNLGIEVVAEGAETKEQLALLEKFGCHIIQGFYYSKPLPLEDVVVYLQSMSATS